MADRPDALGAEIPEELLRELAKVAREKDMLASNDTARVAGQASILINGGAATAILASLSNLLSNYLSKGAGPVSPELSSAVQSASHSMYIYVIGVCFGAVSLWCSSQAAVYFGLRWEEVFLKGKKAGQQGEKAGEFHKTAMRWIFGHRMAFWISIVAFASASWLVMRAFITIVR